MPSPTQVFSSPKQTWSEAVPLDDAAEIGWAVVGSPTSIFFQTSCPIYNHVKVLVRNLFRAALKAQDEAVVSGFGPGDVSQAEIPFGNWRRRGRERFVTRFWIRLLSDIVPGARCFLTKVPLRSQSKLLKFFGRIFTGTLLYRV